MKTNLKNANNKFVGVFTALVTPFIGGEVDEDSLRKVVQNQLENGVQGFVVNGTTAESPTLTQKEVEKIFALVRSENSKRVPLLLGTGSNSTAQTIESTKRASQWGADGALVVVPYYNKPPQRGLVAHFKKVAESSDIPIMLYNVPSRTITSLGPEAIGELSEIPQIAGVKEASADMDLAKKILAFTREDFTFSSGDDESCMDLARLGGHGVISVASHVFPKEFVVNMERARQGEKTPQFDALKTAIKSLYLESSPIPLKMALFKMGLIKSPELRLPLTSMAENLSVSMLGELRKVGVKV